MRMYREENGGLVKDYGLWSASFSLFYLLGKDTGA